MSLAAELTRNLNVCELTQHFDVSVIVGMRLGGVDEHKSLVALKLELEISYEIYGLKKEKKSKLKFYEIQTPISNCKFWIG